MPVAGTRQPGGLLNRLRLKPEPIDRVLGPFHRFIETECSAGIVLLASAVAALVWANSQWSAQYHSLWDTELTVALVGPTAFAFEIAESLRAWVNHALMALFFFVVGLEIKREVLVGELSSRRQAALPVTAALGGMLVPALLFLVVNRGGEVRGWGVPMATDIAFAVGILALAGGRVPLAAKVFLMAFAIADDIGATLVIALFYTEHVSLNALALAGCLLAVMAYLNWAGVRNTLVYVLLAAGMWLAFMKSGVHPTISGILAAMAIPARSRVSRVDLVASMRELLDRFEEADTGRGGVLVNSEQRAMLEEIEHISFQGQTPLQRIQHIVHPWVSFVVMPLFALANAGVPLRDAGALAEPVTLGIVLGLVIGKPLGIVAFAWLAVKAKLAALPASVTWRHILALGALGGVGFTMSLFVAGLAYEAPGPHAMAKVGILAGSLISGVLGLLLLRRLSVTTPRAPASG